MGTAKSHETKESWLHLFHTELHLHYCIKVQQSALHMKIIECETVKNVCRHLSMIDS